MPRAFSVAGLFLPPRTRSKALPVLHGPEHGASLVPC